jgi:hypothetical protein
MRQRFRHVQESQLLVQKYYYLLDCVLSCHKQAGLLLSGGHVRCIIED